MNELAKAYLNFVRGPADILRVTSFYGSRISPITGLQSNHAGIDFGVSGNALNVFTATVESNYWNNARGWTILLNHGIHSGKKIQTLHQHLKEKSPLLVGDKINHGFPVGIIGTTGSSTGVHLHFEVRVDGSPVNPMIYLMTLPSIDIKNVLSIEKDEYILEIKRLQEHLKKMGLYLGVVDGMFGVKTETALKAYQIIKKIKVDGICGPGTRLKLKEGGYEK